MTPSARLQAAIELLDQIIGAAQADGAPADRLIADYFRQRRYAGSKDRRAVRELVFSAIRTCGEIPASGRAAMLALGQNDPAILELFDGSGHGPAQIASGETPAGAGIAPRWLTGRLAASGNGEQESRALMERAPLDIRVNSLKAARDMLVLPEVGVKLEAGQGLRFPSGTNVEQWDEFREGLIEVQDHGSQLVCETLDAGPGDTVIDLCAGAGGKTLALAARMENRGNLIACDIDRKRLSRLQPRANRAGAAMIRTLLLDPGREIERLAGFARQADLVLVDAPCSGTGTWRRKPEAKWRLTSQRLDQFCATQDRLLEIAAGLVRAGGQIVFVTCSLLDEEGQDRIESFLARNPGWQAIEPKLPLGRAHANGWRLTPFADETDGFFLAKLVSPC